jgi:nucleotide-binding universal stress UspA family protein
LPGRDFIKRGHAQTVSASRVSGEVRLRLPRLVPAREINASQFVASGETDVQSISFPSTSPTPICRARDRDGGASLSKSSNDSWLVNVMPMTPVMLAEYVPPDFDVQQRKSAEGAGHRRARIWDREPPHFGRRPAGRHLSEILEEAADIGADLIVMTSHRPSMQSYFLGSNAGHVVRYKMLSARGATLMQDMMA